MFFIPGFLISLVTFPGVIVHEFAHQLFCRLARVAIFDVCYFRLGNPAGYVIHETPRYTWQHILIGIGPFLVNSIVGAVIAAPGAVPVLQFESGGVFDYFLIWLGVSIAMHAFPSRGDAASIWQAISHLPSSSPAKLIGIPIVGLIYIGAFGSMFWLDAAYGILIALALPRMIIALFA